MSHNRLSSMIVSPVHKQQTVTFESPASPMAGGVASTSPDKQLRITPFNTKQLLLVDGGDYVEIMSPEGQHRIKVRNPKIPIEVKGPEKYRELEQINNQILSMTVVPDFGYK